MKNFKNSYLPFLLLFIQPVFMASNLIVARGGVEYVPPISLAFWRWAVVVLLLLPFTYSLLIKNSKIIKKEFKKLFFLGAMGCGVCGAFPFLAGETTTVTNMGIIYTSSPIFIIMISAIFFNEKINLTKIIGLVSCLIGVFAIIIKGDLNFLLDLNFTIGDLWMLANIHKSPIVKFRSNKKFKSPLMIIAKTPIKQETKPIILVRLIFSLKKIADIIIINIGDEV